MSVVLKVVVSVVAIFILFPYPEGSCQGNLLIMPRRVIFEGGKKAQELTLANTGTDTAKYVVSFVQMRMKEDGSFTQITVPDSGQNFSDKYFRIFPRTVILAPKKSQVVKMQLLKTSKMLPGEYRSHIYFRSVPKARPLGDDPSQKDSMGVSVHLIPIFGITIPAIIRIGECAGKVDIKDLSIEKINDTVTRMHMKLIRSGNISVYGDMTVHYTNPQGKTIRVAAVKGIAVYTPNQFRTFQFDLDRVPNVDYHKGKLFVLYSAAEDTRSSKLAEGELILHE